jgi:hypothetical protein
VAFGGAPTPSPAQAGGNNNLGPATPGTKVCTVTTNNLDEITGMVATNAGIYAVEGGDTFEPSGVVIWTIDASTCAATSRNYGFSPVDPQDLALGSDGAIWVGDIGDGIGSDNQRSRLTFEKVQPEESGQAVPYRALYPTSGPFHAEAMLLQANVVPLVFVNESGKVGLYSTGSPPPANTTNGLPTMTRVGEFTPARTGTKNPLGSIGNALVTGAARSPDGRKIVLRTASDAYEFPVGADGDLVKAITQGTPVITPLPDEENGQSISYSPDGTRLLTLTSSQRPVLRSYTPYVPSAAGPTTQPAGPTTPGTDRGFFESLSFSDITMIAILFGLAGMGTMIAGIVGVVLHRRRLRDQEGEPDDEEAPRPPRARRSSSSPDGRALDDRGSDGRTRRPDERGQPGGRPGRAPVPAGAAEGGSPRSGRSHLGGGSHGGGFPGGSHGGPPGGSYAGGGAPVPGGSRGASGRASVGPGGGGSTYRGSAKVGQPPVPEPQVPPQELPPKPRRPSGGQVYGSSSRYSDDSWHSDEGAT